MNFVTDLPDPMALGYSGILVIVDCLTRMDTNIPCSKDIDSPERACMVFEHVICKRRVLDNFTTNRGTVFTSQFWNRVRSHLSVNHQLSTAVHTRIDCQTERQP
jgi:glycosylphosphatidylinositol phospholipase D